MHETESPEDLPPPPVKTDDEHPYAIFRNRDFTLYLIGRLVAVLGQQMFTMALGWEIYERTCQTPYSALALGLVGLVQMIPMFCSRCRPGMPLEIDQRKKIVGADVGGHRGFEPGRGLRFLAARAGLLDFISSCSPAARPTPSWRAARPPFCRRWWTGRISRARRTGTPASFNFPASSARWPRAPSLAGMISSPFQKKQPGGAGLCHQCAGLAGRVRAGRPDPAATIVYRNRSR